MLLSSELVYTMTRNHNSFLRKNLHQTFTTDSFSSTGATNAGLGGFHAKRATAIQVASGKKADKSQVTVTTLSSKRRITKKCKKNNTKARNWSVSSKTVASKKATGHRCSHLAVRGTRLHQAAIRSARLNKQNK